VKHRAVLLLLMLLARGGAAQDPPPVFSATLEMVKVTVTVQDQKGRHVTDLIPEDFVLLEEGRVQPLTICARSFDPGHDEVLALDLGLLFDTSESMAQALKFSQQAAVRFLDSIPRAHDLLVLFFDQDIRISRYDSEHQQGLFSRIYEARGQGRTALYDAIASYLARIQESRGRNVLVILTDGENTMNGVGPSQALDLLRSSSVTVYPIAFQGQSAGGLVAAQARAFLAATADMTGGRVFRPGGTGELPEIYRSILNDLESQYVLGYVPDNPRRDGRYRKVKVEVAREGLKVRHRVGYVAPGPAADRSGR
jgi:Ca-activated chloride channel homolog